DMRAKKVAEEISSSTYAPAVFVLRGEKISDLRRASRSRSGPGEWARRCSKHDLVHLEERCSEHRRRARGRYEHRWWGSFGCPPPRGAESNRIEQRMPSHAARGSCGSPHVGPSAAKQTAPVASSLRYSPTRS